jgi:3'-phosphoadenosine 5'-phosphosulfate sulfotransferase (PAPS reductase)/FAD synthetase
MGERSPYHTEGPAIISFSGGRTSGYMLRQILDAHGGTLPDDIKAVFCNTGKERPETLNFVQECGERWGVHITWLEYRYTDGKHRCEVVSHNSASRSGEPFNQLIGARGFLPNPVSRFCSIEMKIRTTYRWVRAELGWDHWTTVIGLRADEPRRVAKSKARSTLGKDRFDTDCPLARAGVTKQHVSEFWGAQPFDLRLLNVNGTTPDGNCDNCFLKSLANIAGRARRDPGSLVWWAEAEAEAEARTNKPSGARFRSDRPGYAEIIRTAGQQGDMIGDEESALDCACTD